VYAGESPKLRAQNKRQGKKATNSGVAVLADASGLQSSSTGSAENWNFTRVPLKVRHQSDVTPPAPPCLHVSRMLWRANLAPS